MPRETSYLDDSFVLIYAPLNFDLSLLEIWTPLAKGATVILADIAHATQSDVLFHVVPGIGRLRLDHRRGSLRRVQQMMDFFHGRRSAALSCAMAAITVSVASGVCNYPHHHCKHEESGKR
ncbi:MAG: hypothetical protein ACOY4D_12930 [Pseudomonadota bacterium]